jgi:TorA maturation chaperone TorD
MTEASVSTVVTQRAATPEEEARGNFYALLARLDAEAPDVAFLGAIAAAEPLAIATEQAAARDLAHAWDVLRTASAGTDPDAVAAEYQELFVGVGKSEVSLHASAYVSGSGGSALASIRGALAALGLGRQPEVNVFEDHLSSVLEVMRVLIVGGPGVEPMSVLRQREFFLAYVSPWVLECCNAIQTSAIANYYRRVAEFTAFFVAIERDSFAIE